MTRRLAIFLLCVSAALRLNLFAALVTGPVNDASTGLPGTTPLHFRLLSTVLSGTNLFPTRNVDLTATNGQFTQYLAPGNWYVQIGTNKDAFQFSMPSDNGIYPLYTLLPPGVTYIFTPSSAYNLISADQAAQIAAAQTGSAALTNLANGDASGLTNLPSGGGSQTPFTNNVDAAGHALTGVSTLSAVQFIGPVKGTATDATNLLGTISGYSQIAGPLNVGATNASPSNAVHLIYSKGTFNGSTLEIGALAPSLYADTYWCTAPDLANLIGNPTLHFAIGVAVPAQTFVYPGSSIYQNPYCEMYDSTGFMFVNYPYRVGGFESNTLNFALYPDNGDLDHPGFYYSRSANTLAGSGSLGSTSGDVTGTLDNMAVNSVGGASAGNISATVTMVQGANSSANPSSLPLYDFNGDLTAHVFIANQQVQTPLIEFPATAVQISSGNGDPISNGLDNPIGSLYLQADGGSGTALWVNESGGPTGWVSK